MVLEGHCSTWTGCFSNVDPLYHQWERGGSQPTGSPSQFIQPFVEPTSDTEPEPMPAALSVCPGVWADSYIRASGSFSGGRWWIVLSPHPPPLQLSLPKFGMIDLRMISCAQALPPPLVPPSSNSSLLPLVPPSHKSSILLCLRRSHQAPSLLHCPAQSPSSPSAKSHWLLMVPSSLPLPPSPSKPSSVSAPLVPSRSSAPPPCTPPALCSIGNMSANYFNKSAMTWIDSTTHKHIYFELTLTVQLFILFSEVAMTEQTSLKCDSVIYLRGHCSFCQHVEQWSHKSVIYYHGDQGKIQDGASVLNKSVQEFGVVQIGRAWDGLWSNSTLKTKLIWGCIRYENAYWFAEGTVLYYEMFFIGSQLCNTSWWIHLGYKGRVWHSCPARNSDSASPASKHIELDWGLNSCKMLDSGFNLFLLAQS